MGIRLDTTELLSEALFNIWRHRAGDDFVPDRIEVHPFEIDWLSDGIEGIGKKDKYLSPLSRA